ncbi:MAG: dipeptide epimerase [Deltaproteobacteria bacterium]|nr:dipeptide epimerase [Deltaproteobacteria bacterium]
MRIDSISAEPFSLPLLEPFAIARVSVDTTRAVLVRARVVDGSNAVEGVGECALPLRAAEEPDDLARVIASAAASLEGSVVDDVVALTRLVDGARVEPPVARCGLHAALLDGLARLSGAPVHVLLGSETRAPRPLVTDITLPIAEPSHLADLARAHWARGFRIFKVKVGRDLASDRRTVRLVAGATPSATLRFDANEGFGADESLALLAHARELGVHVDCFEQPCARDDLDGIRRVREEGGGVPVVADESVRDLADLDRLVAARAVDGVNLKLVKTGGIDRCLALGRAAQERGLRLMVGAMVESRLGLTAMAHVAAALGGADWVDLDTAFLLARDRCRGGFHAEGATLSLPDAPGFAITVEAA